MYSVGMTVPGEIITAFIAGVVLIIGAIALLGKVALSVIESRFKVVIEQNALQVEQLQEQRAQIAKNRARILAEVKNGKANYMIGNMMTADESMRYEQTKAAIVPTDDEEGDGANI